MVKEIIITDKELINTLERLQNDVQSRQALLSYMLNSMTISINTDNFRLYQKEYEDAFVAYEKQKRFIENTYVYPNAADAKSWDLNFDTGVLKITV